MPSRLAALARDAVGRGDGIAPLSRADDLPFE